MHEGSQEQHGNCQQLLMRNFPEQVCTAPACEEHMKMRSNAAAHTICGQLRLMLCQRDLLFKNSSVSTTPAKGTIKKGSTTNSRAMHTRRA